MGRLCATLFTCLIVSTVAYAPLAGGILITEVQYDPVGSDTDGEWIEIYNPGAVAIDLSNHKIGDEETSGGGEGMQQFPAGTSIDPGEFMIVARGATGFNALFGFLPQFEINDTNPTVPDTIHYGAWATDGVALANGGDDVLILDGVDAVVDAVSWESSTFAFNPSVPAAGVGESIERIVPGVDTDTAADWQVQSNPTPTPEAVTGILLGICSVMLVGKRRSIVH